MKIILVCLGNICRSPLAEGIFRQKLPSDFTISSAGTTAMHEGEHPDKRAIKTADNHGIDISKQRAHFLTKADILAADRVYCMDLNVMKDVISISPDEASRKKIFLLLEISDTDDEANDVPDPYWGGMPEFEQVFNLIDDAADRISKELLAETA